jgi:predicted enzyme related to lactoylglutathione lyase
MKGAPGPGDMMMVEREGDGISGGVLTTQHGQPSVAVYVGVGDIDAQFGKIERAGGHMAMPKFELPNDMGFIAGFKDPAGNWIGLWQPSKKPAAPTKKSAKAVKKKAAAPKPKKKASKKKASKR